MEREILFFFLSTPVSYTHLDVYKRQEETGELIAACVLCIYTIIPRPGSPCGKCGLLVNVNTRKDYRRRGIAARMLAALFAEARRMGVERIELDYTCLLYTSGCCTRRRTV